MKLLMFAVTAAVLTACTSGPDLESVAHNPDHLDHHELDEKYYHLHDGHEHDLSMAYIGFDSIPLTQPETQLHGRWVLERLESTDTQMMGMLKAAGYEIWMDVGESALQVTVRLDSTGKDYQDPPLEYVIEDGSIRMVNEDFAIGVREGVVVLTLIGMDEAYRYTFIRD